MQQDDLTSQGTMMEKIDKSGRQFADDLTSQGSYMQKIGGNDSQFDDLTS